MIAAPPITDAIIRRLGSTVVLQPTRDRIPTLWVKTDQLYGLLSYLKYEVEQPYKMLYDLTAIDERMRTHRDSQPPSDLTVVYHLLSFDRNDYVRIKVALAETRLSMPSIVGIWPAANWYEREVWDMFGIVFDGHPHLQRILMPKSWVGHPLRKDHPARATEMGPYQLPPDKELAEQEAMRFRPEDWGMSRARDDADFVFLNVGPQHPGTHGVLRIALQLDGEEIVDAVPDIGFHHRGAEKMGERQSWHTYIPYTDRIDYLGGVMNNLAYLSAVEKLADITVPPRAQVIRVMLAELFRINSHLVWYGTLAQDLGQMSPVFYTFNDRERTFGIIEAICGARMHPSWFRIGGVAADLPKGWERMFREFITYLPPRLVEYDREVLQNRIFKGRTQGIGRYTVDDAPRQRCAHRIMMRETGCPSEGPRANPRPTCARRPPRSGWCSAVLGIRAPPVRAECSAVAVRLGAVVYVCPGSAPTAFPQGISGLDGATGSFRRRVLRGCASWLAAGGVVSAASGVGVAASAPGVRPNVRSIQFRIGNA